MSTLPAATLPERAPRVGELVHVRSRRWPVEEVVDPPPAGESSRVLLACASAPLAASCPGLTAFVSALDDGPDGFVEWRGSESRTFAAGVVEPFAGHSPRKSAPRLEIQ